MDDFRSMPIAPGKNEFPFGMRAFLELVKRLDQAPMIFSGMLQARNVKETRRIVFAFGFGREKARMLDAVVNDIDPLLRQTEKFLHVVSGRLTDGNDFVLTPHQR